MLARVDVPPALVVPLEMQATRRDDAEQALQRREAHRSRRHAGQARALAPLEVALPLRGHPVAAGSHRLAQAGGMRRQLDDRGVVGRAGPARAGQRPGAGAHGQRLAHEAAPRAARLGHQLGRQEVLGSLLDPAGRLGSVGHRGLRISMPDDSVRLAAAVTGSSSWAKAISRFRLSSRTASRPAMCTQTVRQISVSAGSAMP